MSTYFSIFSNVPGKTDRIKCHLELTTAAQINVKQYPLPFATSKDIEAKLQQMKVLYIIEVSRSPCNFPILLVDKPDKTKRFVINFCRLNGILIADAEPMPRADAVFPSVANKK